MSTETLAKIREAIGYDCVLQPLGGAEVRCTCRALYLSATNSRAERSRDEYADVPIIFPSDQVLWHEMYPVRASCSSTGRG